MVLITFILLFITLLVYTLTSENKQKAMLISLGLVVSYVACTTSFFTTLVLWENASSVPAFATLLLILIIIVLFVYILVSKKKKRAWLISLGIIATYHFVVFCNCGPNIWDIRVMKPMAKAIGDYIVKHGIPKSLSEIPNLPYELEGCEKKEGFPYSLFCTFNKDYSVEFADDPNHRYYSVNFYAPNSSTGMDIDFKVVDGKRLMLEKSTPRLPNPHIYSSKITGICNPMRQ